MVRESTKILQRMAVAAAMLLTAGIADADIVTGAGAGAGPGKAGESGGNKPRQGAVKTAVGDINGDGKGAPKQPVAPIAPIARPVTPIKPMPSSGPTSIQSQPKKPQEALLVPAVQKVRESAARPK